MVRIHTRTHWFEYMRIDVQQPQIMYIRSGIPKMLLVLLTSTRRCWLSLHFSPCSLASILQHYFSPTSYTCAEMLSRWISIYSIENNNLWPGLWSNRQAPYHSPTLMLQRYHDYGTIFAYEWLNWIKNSAEWMCVQCTDCLCECGCFLGFCGVFVAIHTEWMYSIFFRCTESMLTRSDIEFITICSRRLWFFLFACVYVFVFALLTLVQC